MGQNRKRWIEKLPDPEAYLKSHYHCPKGKDRYYHDWVYPKLSGKKDYRVCKQCNQAQKPDTEYDVYGQPYWIWKNVEEITDV